MRPSSPLVLIKVISETLNNSTPAASLDLDLRTPLISLSLTQFFLGAK